MLRFGDASGGKAIQLPPLTLSTILTARAVNVKLSRLALASSPGALTAPQMARRLRSARLSPSSAIQNASPVAPSRRSNSWCWLRALATDSAGKVKAAKRGLMIAGTGNSAPVKRLRSRRSSITRPSRMPYAGPRCSRHSCPATSSLISMNAAAPSVRSTRRYRAVTGAGSTSTTFPWLSSYASAFSSPLSASVTLKFATFESRASTMAPAPSVEEISATQSTGTSAPISAVIRVLYSVEWCLRVTGQ